MNIAFLPTGDTEWKGLSDAFKSLFPNEEHQFTVLPSAEEIQSSCGDYPYPGFTSNPLSTRHVSSPPEAASELIGIAAQAALGDRHKAASDLVIILDDLEPANVHQPETETPRTAQAIVKPKVARMRFVVLTGKKYSSARLTTFNSYGRSWLISRMR